MSFWDSIDYSKARKVVCIPNITLSKDLSKDSWTNVMRNHILSLEKHFPGEYFWHILIPTGKATQKLNLYNTKQHELPISGDMMDMRAFPSIQLKKLLSTIDYDVIYSHLPDWPQVGRYRKKLDTKIYGYSHWSEFKWSNGVDARVGKPKYLWFLVEILGILQMETCYVNTQDQKNKILEEASEKFDSKTVKLLDEKIQIWNLGLPKEDIVESPSKDKRKIIVFNHRPAAYKGYPKFIKLMEEYRQQRISSGLDEFVVWVPQLTGRVPHSWIDNKKVPKHEYYERLKDCMVGVQMRQTNYGWSVSATDCLMNGTPMIWQESDCYREIDPNGLFWTNKKDFFKMLDKILDDDNYRRDLELKAIQRAHELSENEDRMIKKLHKNLSN